MNNPIEALFHPPFDSIEALASGHATEKECRAVSVHLQECPGCQERVRELRTLALTAREEPVPAMSSQLRNRIVERARSGERRIIPIGPAGAVTPSRVLHSTMIGLAAAAAIAAVMLIPGRGLEAGPTAGVLVLAQRASLPAPMLAVHYTAPETFADADSVRLRAETYIAKTPGPSIARDYWLRRERNGVYTAEVALPKGTVFARYSVVSPDGRHTDDNDARGWERPVTDATGRPLYEGLWVQHFVNQLGNWELSSAAARTMMKYYPENPASFRYALSDEMLLAGPSRANIVIAQYRPRIVALHERYVNAALDPSTMWEWAMLLAQIGDTARTRQWRERMVREYPRDAGTIQQRVFALAATHLSSAQRAREMERIWHESGGQSVQLLVAGFDLATMRRDSAAVARWGYRMMKFGGPYSGMVPAQYVTVPAFRSRGETMLRQSLSELPPVPSVEWRAALRNTTLDAPRRGQWQLLALGKALLDDGLVASARDTLRRAASLGWDARTMGALGDAALAAGDTAEATNAYAWVVADSRTSKGRGDTLRAKLGASGRSAAWANGVAAGRVMIGGLTLRTAVRRPFDASATYTDVTGNRRSLKQIVRAPLSIVAFVSRHCAPSLADAASLDRVAAVLIQRGVPVLTLVGDEASNKDAVITLAKHGFTGALAFDDRSEVSRRMRQAGTPHYFVVEDGKVIRYDARRADDLLMLVESLQATH